MNVIEVYGKVLGYCMPDVIFHIPADSKKHARRQAEHLAEDMQHSVKLRRAWEITPGHIGIGEAGIKAARRAT